MKNEKKVVLSLVLNVLEKTPLIREQLQRGLKILGVETRVSQRNFSNNGEGGSFVGGNIDAAAAVSTKVHRFNNYSLLSIHTK